MPSLPDVPLAAVLDRLDAAWQPWNAAHGSLLGMSGAGKTTLLREILARCAAVERVAILDPKVADDPSWTTGPDTPAAVTALPPRFGEHHDGGGPSGLWYRLAAAPDPQVTARRFITALRLIQAEGHALVVLDDAHETCQHPGVRQEIDRLLTLGRSAVVSCLVATGDASYVPRGQFSFRWIGQTSGLPAAKAAASMLGVRGRDWEDTLAALAPWQWVYSDTRPGSPGPCRTALPEPR